MGRPREHDEATRQALLAAAEHLVEVGGPDAASVRAVADAVGTSTRAVYSLFGSKDGLLEALATRLFESLGQAIDDVPRTDDPAHDIVVASLDGFRRTALDHPSLYSLVFLRVVPDLQLGPDFGIVASAAFDRLVQLVHRLDDAGGLHATTAADAATTIHALGEGLATMELRGQLGPPERADRVWTGALVALLAGLAQAPAATPRRRRSKARTKVRPTARAT